ncbi:MAG: zinc-ribbon domain-containing protein, partial [Deltaproteobacteria bacterium]|nr:zinc-ribbon domain-containing protein [Deltaproteobacteria bacterium]
MRVKCGNCGTAYDIDEKLFGGDKVVRVRCSKCRSVFSPKKPSMPNVNAETRLPFFQTTSNSTVHTVGRQKVEKSMLVKCSNCGTAYNFDERLFSGQMLRVRCSRCRHVFSV